MVVKRCPLVMGVALVTCLIIAALYLLRAPYPSRREVALIRARLYESWCRETKKDYEAFKDLASANGWQMFVWTNDGQHGMSGWGTGIGRLDYGQSTYTALYKTSGDRFVEGITSFREGKAAFIECTKKFPFFLLWGGIKRRNFELGVVQSDGTVAKVPIPDMDLLADIAIGKRYVLFSEFYDRMWLYDMRDQAVRRVPKPQGWEGNLKRLAFLGDRFLLIGTTPGRPLVVVEAKRPYAEVSRIEDVWNTLVVGDHVVVQKDDVCFLYHPETGRTERLTPGRLVVAIEKDEFLFCEPDARSPAYLTGVLHRYNIPNRSADVFWRPPKGDGGFRIEPGGEKEYEYYDYYEYEKLTLSPDHRFLFLRSVVPPNSKRETVLTYEYDVYDVRSGEKRGSFLTIHEGKFYFEFLGWDTSALAEQVLDDRSAEAEKVTKEQE